MATRETKYSHGVIPSSEPIYRYTGKKREQVNKNARPNWAEQELKMWEKHYKESATNFGYAAGQVTIATNNYNKAKEDMESKKFHVDILNKAKEDNDFVALMEEEQFGVVPHSKNITFEDLNINVCLGYIQSVYGLEKAILVNQVLRNAE